MPRSAAAEAAADFLRIAASPHSTERALELLRLFADEFDSGTLELAADRLAGEAKATGPKPRAADAALLAAIEQRRPIHGTGTVSAVARAAFPGDERAQYNAGQRLRRQIRARKMHRL